MDDLVKILFGIIFGVIVVFAVLGSNERRICNSMETIYNMSTFYVDGACYVQEEGNLIPLDNYLPWDRR